MSVVALVRRYERRRRFWRNVRVGGPDDCWPWLGKTDAGGLALYRGRPACETAWELSVRQPAPGASLQHRCGHAWCVNPRHLARRGAAPPAPA
jgi:hypothetical protein